MTRSSEDSAWKDPKVWISIIGTINGFLLSILVFIGSSILNKISTFDSNLQALNISTTKTISDHEARLKSLEDSKKNNEANQVNQTAYNFDLNRAMTTIITQLRDRGYDTPMAPIPPNPRNK